MPLPETMLTEGVPVVGCVTTRVARICALAGSPTTPDSVILMTHSWLPGPSPAGFANATRSTGVVPVFTGSSSQSQPAPKVAAKFTPAAGLLLDTATSCAGDTFPPSTKLKFSACGSTEMVVEVEPEHPVVIVKA